MATAEAERDELRARVAELEAESVRARADGDRLRGAHAAMLGDELAAARVTVAELQAAASAPSSLAVAEPVAAVAAVPDVAVVPEVPVADVAGADVAELEETEPEAHPPLPLRVAGRHKPAPPLARRRPRQDPTLAKAPAEPQAYRALARLEIPPEAPAPEAPPTEVPVAEVPVAEVPVAEEPVAEPAAAAAPTDASHRRTALAEFTALASSGDDFSFRRR